MRFAGLGMLRCKPHRSYIKREGAYISAFSFIKYILLIKRCTSLSNSTFHL